jgi:hypothetical protein
MHPLAPDLSKLSLDELNGKYAELMQRLSLSHRWGRPDMVAQLQLLMQGYQQEIQSRNQKALEAMEKSSGKFKHIIDIQ